MKFKIPKLIATEFLHNNLDSYCTFSSDSLLGFCFLKKKLCTENDSFFGMLTFLWVYIYKIELSVD